MGVIKNTIHKYPFLVVALSCIFVTLACSVFLYGNLQNQVDQINQERSDRIDSLARVVSENCRENNEQDNILAGLLEISLQNTPPKESLTQQDLQALIVFTTALNDLEKPSSCRRLVRNLLVVQGLSQAQIKQVLGDTVKRPKTDPPKENQSSSAPPSGGAGGSSGATTQTPQEATQTPSTTPPSQTTPPDNPGTGGGTGTPPDNTNNPPPPPNTPPSNPPANPAPTNDGGAGGAVDQIVDSVTDVVCQTAPVVCQQ